jgi:hypothetical protein
MAKLIKTNTVSYKVHPDIKRPGVHAKTRNSNHKTSKHYVKPYRGQGR